MLCSLSRLYMSWSVSFSICTYCKTVRYYNMAYYNLVGLLFRMWIISLAIIFVTAWTTDVPDDTPSWVNFFCDQIEWCFSRLFSAFVLVGVNFQRVLRLFGHKERMFEYRMARRVLTEEVSGGRLRGRNTLGWMDGVKVALDNRGMAWRLRDKARKIGKRREQWGMHNWLSFMRPFFLLGPVFFRTAHRCCSGYHLVRGGMPLHGAVGINCKNAKTSENQGSGVKYTV